MEKNETGSLLTLSVKIQLQVNYRHKCKWKNYKILENSKGIYPHDFPVDKGFL